MGGFQIRKIIKIDPSGLNQPLAIVGMPGIANVGKNTVVTSIESLKAEKILEILFQDFPAQVLIDKNGVAHMPSASVYLSERERDRKDILLVTGDFQPSTPKGIYEFSEVVSQVFHNFNVEIVISTGAFMSNIQISKPKIHVSGTSPAILDKFLAFKDAVLMDYGTISGANGLIPVLANKRYGIEGVCLLADTNPMVMIDPSASKSIIELLNYVLQLKIDAENLLNQIKNMEDLLEEIKNQFSEKKISEEPRYQTYIS